MPTAPTPRRQPAIWAQPPRRQRARVAGRQRRPRRPRRLLLCHVPRRRRARSPLTRSSYHQRRRLRRAPLLPPCRHQHRAFQRLPVRGQRVRRICCRRIRASESAALGPWEEVASNEQPFLGRCSCAMAAREARGKPLRSPYVVQGKGENMSVGLIEFEASSEIE